MNKILHTYLGVALVAFFIVFPHAALAATMSLSAASTNVSAGDLVRVRVVVNAEGVAINTAEGVLQFPTDVLSVQSLDKSGSIFSIWVDEPSFSNQAGSVSFSGGLPSPGYSGSGGTVLTVFFYAKKTGTATISLSGATVRANDGLGTDVLRATSGVQISVVAAQPVTPAPVVPTPAPTTPVKPKPTTATSDTTAPSLSNPVFMYDAVRDILSISVTADDAGSGIVAYDIQIDDASPLRVSGDAFSDGTYEMLVEAPGVHAVTLAAIDKAGNRAQVSGSFTVPEVVTPPVTPPEPIPFFGFGNVGLGVWLVLGVMLLLTVASCTAAVVASYKLAAYQRRNRLSPQVSKDIHRAIKLFKEEMDTHLDALESAKTKRDLTREEISMRADMKTNLAVLEKYIEKELE